MIIASLAFAYSGFALLCAAMRRQYRVVFAAWSFKPAILLLRLAGLVLISAALAYCMDAWGTTVGISAGWLVLAIAGYLVVLTATYFPRQLAYGALAGLLVALLGVLFAAGFPVS